MRKHVKPAHPQATIPDPTRRRDLPAKGYAVDWTAHWARLAARGDVIVTELPETGEAPPPAQDDAGGRAGEPDAQSEPAPAPEEHAEAEEPALEDEHHPDA